MWGVQHPLLTGSAGPALVLAAFRAHLEGPHKGATHMLAMTHIHTHIYASTGSPAGASLGVPQGSLK